MTQSIFRATRSSSYETQWQQERRRGPILPMLPDQKPFFSRIMGLVGRGR